MSKEPIALAMTLLVMDNTERKSPQKPKLKHDRISIYIQELFQMNLHWY